MACPTPVPQQMDLPKPELWNLDSPKLYHVVVKILSGKNGIG